MSAALKRKPKLVHVFDSLPLGGLELGFLNLLKNGFYKDFDLHVVSMAHGTGEIFSQTRDIIGTQKAEYILDKIGFKKADVIPLIFKLERRLAELNPEVIIFSGFRAQIIGHIATFPHFGIRTVSFEHESIPLRRLTSALSSITSLRDSFVFGDTAESLRVKGSGHIGTSESFEVPMSDVDFALPRQPIQPLKFKLLSLGRLEKVKNYFALIEALAILRDEGYDVELTIAGQGSLREPLKTAAKKAGIADHLHFPGFTQDRATLDALRQEAHIYVQSSFNEGQCLALVEALAAGLPCMATDFGGSRDYGISGVNMLKAKGYGAEDIAQPLRYLMDNYAEIAPALSTGAIRTAQEHFGKEPRDRKWHAASDAMMKLTVQKDSARPQKFSHWVSAHLLHKHS